MNTNEQQIAIAETCGWKQDGPCGNIWISPSGKSHEVWGEDRLACPDYPNDLNAMHEAEKFLETTELQNAYYANIAEITWGCEETGDRQVVFNQLTASAAQRAEAFLRTLNLWTET